MAREMVEIVCAVCGIRKMKEARRVRQTDKLGKLHTCSRKCASRVTNDKRIAPPSSKASMNVRNDKKKFPQKTMARRAVREAIRCGKLIPATICERCGKSGKMDGHHEDHYRPYYLVWLCKDCHSIHDKFKLMGYGTDYSEQIEK